MSNKTYADEYWTYANKKLDETARLWGEVEARNETWEESVKGWLQFQITPEMTYWEYIVKTKTNGVDSHPLFEPDLKKVKEIECKEGFFEGDFFRSEDYKYWKNAEAWQLYIRDIPKERLAVDHFKKWFKEDDWQDGDELWEWSTPDTFWQSLSGRGGYAIVRNGKVIETTITIEN
jgi:hypothetical protein